MADKSSGAATASNAMVRTRSGGVLRTIEGGQTVETPLSREEMDDIRQYEEKLRLGAAKDLVARAKNQLVQAEADLAKLKKGNA